jgi:hypothetical protein
MPPNPSAAAIRATTRNVTIQPNMVRFLLLATTLLALSKYESARRKAPPPSVAQRLNNENVS